VVVLRQHSGSCTFWCCRRQHNLWVLRQYYVILATSILVSLRAVMWYRFLLS
jgi:hypothetical protein